ncbi:minor structural protein [Hafnia phage yong3]|nr:minor structural protein [Hafnia phage yong3]
MKLGLVGSAVRMSFTPRMQGEGVELEYSYDDQTAIPAEFAPLYSEQGGKYVLTAVKGIAPKDSITRLEGALAKERNDHKLLKQTYAPLAGKDINEVITALDRIPELELAAKGNIDETKLDQLVQARVAPVKRELEQYKSQLQEKETLISTYREKEVKGKIRQEVVGAATKLKIRQEAIDDAVIYAERYMTVDEATGNVVTKENVSGVPAYLTPEDFLQDLIPKKPHWLPPSVGGGAGGGAGGGVGGANPYTADGWNMSKQMLLWKTNQPLAKRMAEQAGVDPLKPVKPTK